MWKNTESYLIKQIYMADVRTGYGGGRTWGELIRYHWNGIGSGNKIEYIHHLRL